VAFQSGAGLFLAGSPPGWSVPTRPRSGCATAGAPAGHRAMGCGASTAAAAAQPTDAAAKPVTAGETAAPSKPQKTRRGSVEAELDALDDDVTMAVDVESWLVSLGLGEYWTLFENAGYDDLDTVQDMTEEDLVNDVNIVKKGHVKKLLTNIQKLKANSKRSMSSVSIDQVASPMSTSSPVSPTTQPVRRRKGSVEAEIEALEGASGSLQLTASDDADGTPMAPEEEEEGEEDDVPPAGGTAKVAPRARKGSVEQEIEALDDFDAPGLLAEEEEEEEEEEDNETRAASGSAADPAVKAASNDITLDSLREVGTLGVGTFSRVKMVQIKGTNETYALKMMKKTVIEARKQKEHVMNEKNIMLEMTGHPFLLQLRATFKDETYLYMVLELCQGGELFLRLLEEQTLSEESTRFYTGNIVLALEALHAKNNIYRDLKPENILLDTMGYVKIGDFGFAKKVQDRTFTRCGTPEYVSPEMLGRAGHNKGTDYWSLGIFLYECLHG
jgi:hypothetical protein